MMKEGERVRYETQQQYFEQLLGIIDTLSVHGEKLKVSMTDGGPRTLGNYTPSQRMVVEFSDEIQISFLFQERNPHYLTVTTTYQGTSVDTNIDLQTTNMSAIAHGLGFVVSNVEHPSVDKDEQKISDEFIEGMEYSQ